MSTLVLTQPVIQPVPSPTQRDHASLALLCVLDAEIEALKARLWQRSANAPSAGGLAQADLDRQFGWLQDSVAKLQARRDALC
jgi:uncharacterized small protein (DUF1192 family)